MLHLVTAQGDPTVIEFYLDLDSYPIMLNDRQDYRIVETVVRKERDKDSPTGWTVYIRHRVE